MECVHGHVSNIIKSLDRVYKLQELKRHRNISLGKNHAINF